MSRRISPELRQQICQRAGARCEYCRKPDTAGVYLPHVDHIIPPMHGGKDELDNYAWACFQCNSAKSGQIASYDFET
jgi:5-methylcytosine-specific restriction endonuclease McrA